MWLSRKSHTHTHTDTHTHAYKGVSSVAKGIQLWNDKLVMVGLKVEAGHTTMTHSCGH